MNKKKILNDPVYGFITVHTELIFDLIEHRYFQRLRRIKQMGLTHYVYPGALHTRFHHALGAMHLMYRAIETLRSKGVQVSSEEAEGGLVAILLHDIGHGPYSHTLEGLLVDCSHEELTKLYMQELNNEFDGRLETAIAIFNGEHPKAFLHELITGQLDLDRMDYLKRDSFFSGVAEGTVGHDRIITMLDVKDNHIVVEVKGRFSIEQFLMARRLMYWQVYLHKAGLAAEMMLRRFVALLRDQVRKGTPPEGFELLTSHLRRFLEDDIDPADSTVKMLESFSHLDDVDIVHALKIMETTDQASTAYLAGSLLRRNLFHTQFLDMRPSRSYVDQIVERINKNMGFSEEEAAQLVVEGYERIPTYKAGKNEIMMLLKDGDVIPLSRILQLGHSAVSEAHYLCYPKAVR